MGDPQERTNRLHGDGDRDRWLDDRYRSGRRHPARAANGRRARGFHCDKLNPAIENTPALKAKVKPQVSRSGEGSTTYLKRYPGGSMALAIANSTADLRSKDETQDRQG
jgi:hypothetical protein